MQRGARLEQLCFVCLFGGAKNSVLISFTFSSLFQEVVENLNTHQIIFCIIDMDYKRLCLGKKKCIILKKVEYFWSTFTKSNILSWGRFIYFFYAFRLINFIECSLVYYIKAHFLIKLFIIFFYQVIFLLKTLNTRITMFVIICQWLWSLVHWLILISCVCVLIRYS